MAIRRICALTMVRNDDFYLRKWTEYYGKELGEEHLYIFLDGKDQPIPSWCPKAHIVAVEKIKGQVVEAEKGRLDFLSKEATKLLDTYDLVIGCDADEFLVVDPAKGLGLAEYLSTQRIRTSLSGLGVDVGQRTQEEGIIRNDAPWLAQRHYARLSTRYTKPCVVARPLRWGRGFHRIKGHNFRIDPHLYLFHFGYFDLERLRARFEDPSRRDAGWTAHLKRRSKTIRLVSGQRKAHEWNSATRKARMMQQIVRPPYAWNKPAMFGKVVIVRIPERFSHIV